LPGGRRNRLGCDPGCPFLEHRFFKLKDFVDDLHVSGLGVGNHERRGAAATGGLDNLARKAQMKEFSSPLPQEDYVRLLLAANEKLVADAAQARDGAGEANDPETQDLMIARITLHQKTIWMLKSFLKG